MSDESVDLDPIFAIFSREKEGNRISYLGRDVPDDAQNLRAKMAALSQGEGENQHFSSSEFLKHSIDLNQLSDEQLKVLRSLHGDEKERAARLCLQFPLDLSIATKKTWLGWIFVKDTFSQEELVRILPVEIDFSRITLYGRQIFQDLWFSLELSENITERFPSILDLHTINADGADLLQALVQYGDRSGLEVLQRLGEIIDLGNTNKYWNIVVFALIQTGFSSAIADKLPEFIRLEDLSKPGLSLLEELMNYETSDRIHLDPIHDALKFSPREPMKITDFDQQLPGIYLEKQLQFLKDRAQLEYSRGEWKKYNLKKSGSTTDIFMNEKAKKIIFRAQGAFPDELEQKKQAMQELPDFVSGPVYQELFPDKKRSEFFMSQRQWLNREVFSGIALGMLELKYFPDEVRKSILAQKAYIRLKLLELGIIHEHPHDLNFNVRFLLIGSDGERTIVFEPRKAFEQAISPGYSIVPIVTIRDWDRQSLR